MLKRVTALVLLLLGALWVFGPYEPVELDAAFDTASLDAGVANYVEAREAAFDDIKPGSEMRIVWQPGFEEKRTPLSLVYLHGFSANAEEIRPVPDHVANRLGANLVYTRLTGHGRSNDALAEASIGAWMRDMGEAMAIGRAVGERVIILSTSTGGTLAAVGALDPELSRNVAGIVMVSPNFGIKNPLAPMLTLPAARYWLPLLAGDRRSFEPLNEGQAQHWTTEYPSAAVFPMAALVKHAVGQSYDAVTVPALFYFSDKDMVVDAAATRKIMQSWGGPVDYVAPGEEGAVDPFFHVVAGDILSPNNTQVAAEAIFSWAQGL